MKRLSTRDRYEQRKQIFLRRNNKGIRKRKWNSLFLRKLISETRKIAKSRLFTIAIVSLTCCVIAILISEDNLESSEDIARLLFEDAESISIITAAIVFLLEISSRRKKDHYEAWQVINSAQGKSGSGGRVQALQDLNEDGVSLEGVSAPEANLADINLRYGPLKGANFSFSNLENANLKGADLSYANLAKANLSKANLSYADLSFANFEGANLERANLEGSELRNAILNKSNLYFANLRGAFLDYAKINECELEEADLSQACLKAVDIKNSNLLGTVLKETYLYYTDFESSFANSVDLRKAVLHETKFTAVNLTHADFEGATNIRKKKLSVSQLMKYLSAAKLGATKLSDGTIFDPDYTFDSDYTIGSEEKSKDSPLSNSDKDTKVETSRRKDKFRKTPFEFLTNLLGL
jgi:uncharacterized protein YjbI with pentapeptide repeats